MHFWVLISLLLLMACSSRPDSAAPEKPSLTLRAATFADLPGWNRDSQSQAMAAFRKSCPRIMGREAGQAFGPFPESGLYGDWQPVCRKALAFKNPDDKTVRAFFETHFIPWEARAGEDPEGLFTGYYEASLRGSKIRQGPYRHPLYRRPDDLVMVDLGEFREELKGQRIAGRIRAGRLKPYEDRAAIEAGNWPHNDQALVWVDNPVDAFFLHIQGSGRIDLAEGGVMRVGYAGQNGHIYYAVGRELVKTGALRKEDVSMQAIRQWLEAHPDRAADLMNLNKSYVFFEELKGEGPLGGEGVALTPARSLAVDRSLVPYGLPVWVDLEEVVESEGPIRRLMVAQDTGGAIIGPVRGDFYWGYGEEAEYLAGRMKSKGRYWFLLPKTNAAL